MIFRAWNKWQFKEAGFVQVGALPVWERRGFPLYSGTKDPNGTVWIPGWAADLFYGLGSPIDEDSGYDDALVRLSAAAIRSDDPDAFVESALAAYALGGWRAALALAGVPAQEADHAVAD